MYGKLAIFGSAAFLACCTTARPPIPPARAGGACGYVTYKGSFVVVDRITLQAKTYSSTEVADVIFKFHPEGYVSESDQWPALSLRLYADVPQIGQSIKGTMQIGTGGGCPPYFAALDVEGYAASMRWVTKPGINGWN